MTDASKVWMPDTFFRNEKIGRFHTILTPNLYVRVFPDGDVLYSIRWVVTLLEHRFPQVVNIALKRGCPGHVGGLHNVLKVK